MVSYFLYIDLKINSVPFLSDLRVKKGTELIFRSILIVRCCSSQEQYKHKVLLSLKKISLAHFT